MATDQEPVYPLTGKDLLCEFVRQFGSGAQGCEMDCDAVKVLCEAIETELLQE